MKVLVTGGAGFVGSHVVDLLVAGGAEVRVIDRVAPTHQNVAADYATGDVGDGALMGRAVADIDGVCHLAARVGLGVDFDDVEDYVADNDAGTASLLRTLHRGHFGGRVVLASSMVVYGDGVYECDAHGRVCPAPRAVADLAAGRFDPTCERCGRGLNSAPVSEDDKVDPRNTYAATKLHQEHLLASFAREHDASAVALRYHNVYGPRMPKDTPYAGVASIFASALLAGAPPQVFEDGAQRRDFVHVSDVARATVLALTAPLRQGMTACNVASGEPHTVGELAWALRRSLGGPEPVVTGAWRLGDVRHVVASPARAAEILGFEAKVGFGEGVAALAATLRPVGD